MPALPQTSPSPLDTLAADLADLERRSLRRHLRTCEGPQGPTLFVDGREVLNFCSNNYLGLAHHPKVIRAAQLAMEAEGFGAAGSRLIVGNLAAHRTLESRLATWKGTEATLLFGSGYHANLGCLPALVGPGDAVFSDALNHASLIDGSKLSRAHVHVYPHLDMLALDAALTERRACRRRLIISDSIFSMDGDEAPIANLVELARTHNAMLFLDEAHAVGVLGEGRGLSSDHEVHFQMGTLGKAFGAYGAFVATSQLAVDFLVQRARSFIFSTALPPCLAGAALAALELVAGPEGAKRRAQLAANARILVEGLAALGLPPRSPSHIVPIPVGDADKTMELSHALLARGVFVQGIRPPTVPQGTSRLRLTLMATHKPEQIARVLAALEDLRPLWRS